jgi:hypothetical protein
VATDLITRCLELLAHHRTCGAAMASICGNGRAREAAGLRQRCKPPRTQLGAE